MAEAIAAVSLAGNVLQFLEAGGKFTFRAFEILRHGACGGSRSDLKDLRQITHDFQRLLEHLRNSSASNDKAASSPLASLSMACSDVVKELLEKLDKIGLNDNHKRANLLVIEFKSAWQKVEIENLEKRIARFREQLAVHWITEMRELIAQPLAMQEAVLSEIRGLAKGRSSVSGRHADAPCEQMIKSLSGCLAEEAEQHQLDLLRQEIHARLVELHSSADDGAPQSRQPRQAQLPEDRKLELQRDFLHTLHFREKGYRESAISSPYDSTFRWMFQDTEDPARKDTGFRQWLASSSNLFWVTGKPGAGKSTLMKYISDFHSKGEGATLCQQFLDEWAGSSKIATASFYFWSSGAEIQASQKAMVGSILVDLLQQNADIIPQVVPLMWESACLLGTPFPQHWAEGALGDLLFGTLEELSRGNTRVCLFIDGLDEFDGDAQTIIDFVDKMLQLPDVKLCVSSRPWVAFESAFGRASSLRVQDLTYPDIQHFIQSRFEKSEGFSRLMKREPDYAASLIHHVLEKSSGVFLWVRIVVDSLLAGLTNDDRVCDLERRLDSLPPELNDLFSNILDNIDPFYYEHACQYFQLLLANDGSAEALLLSFADEEKGFSLSRPWARVSDEESTTRLETLERRLRSRSKGLLEMSPDGRVNFLHRTVRDFLDRPSISARVATATRGTDFDAYLQLCSGFHCLIKANMKDGEIKPLLISCLTCASRVTTGKHQMIEILDSLDHDYKSRRNLKGIDRLLWIQGWESEVLENGHGLRLILPAGAPIFHNDILPLATRFGVTDYVRVRAEPGGLYWTDTPSPNEPSVRDMVRGTALGRLLLSRASKQTERPKSSKFALPLFLVACFGTPPNVEMFEYFLGRGAHTIPEWPFRMELKLQAPTMNTHALLKPHSPMLEVAVTVALFSAFAQGPLLAGKAWGSWAPIFDIFASEGKKLDMGLATAVAKRFKVTRRERAPTNRTRLSRQDLVMVFDSLRPGSNLTVNWEVICNRVRKASCEPYTELGPSDPALRMFYE
ncbi:hypothetical protein QBC39DRAFT_275959 [Podospora conica]|nr:hypothetical protein QBC39DRAFT_275959 [Schizothecium conicum]